MVDGAACGVGSKQGKNSRDKNSIKSIFNSQDCSIITYVVLYSFLLQALTSTINVLSIYAVLNERTDAAVSEKRSERHKRKRGSKKRRKIRPKRRPRLIVKQNASTELNESHFQVFPHTHIELQSIMLLSILLNP